MMKEITAYFNIIKRFSSWFSTVQFCWNLIFNVLSRFSFYCRFKCQCAPVQLNVSIKDSKNTQLNADIGIIIPVTDKLDTKITWDWSFDNQPEAGNETIDRKVRFGINYTL